MGAVRWKSRAHNLIVQDMSTENYDLIEEMSH